MKVFGRPDAPETVAVFAFPTFNQGLIFVPAKVLIAPWLGVTLTFAPPSSSNQLPEALLMPSPLPCTHPHLRHLWNLHNMATLVSKMNAQPEFLVSSDGGFSLKGQSEEITKR